MTRGMNASRILVAVVFLAAAGVAGYLVFTGKRA